LANGQWPKLVAKTLLEIGRSQVNFWPIWPLINGQNSQNGQNNNDNLFFKKKNLILFYLTEIKL
jgi:hypothetical protein